jgi:deoxyribodipyrimidine photo-lyase
MRQTWTPGEAAAAERLDAFVDHAVDYERRRNNPSVEGSSRLSPHLHWGEISPRQVWHALHGRRGTGVETFRGEVIWRDFAQNLIAQFPEYGEQSYREPFRHFP